MSDSKLTELAGLISAWPGLVSGNAKWLIEDSLVLLEHLGSARKIVDVGSGGGLPGLPLKISRPDLDITLIEADQAKASFLVHASAALGLDGVEVVAERAEDAARDPKYREAFDLAVARALAPMAVLAELCLPLVRVGGSVLAQKTEQEDLQPAHHAIDVLGGELGPVAKAPSSARRSGTVVVIKKIRPTPDAYPRRPGVPGRRPL